MNEIRDKYLRPLQDLRISIMDKCNFRCSYCMPADVFGEDYVFMREEELLSFDEIERVVKQFTSLGVKKLRLTGGEPLLRKNVPNLIQRLARIEGIEDIALTTNGVYLVKQAKALKEAGLMRVNVSLDALDTEIFQKMNGRNVTSKVVLKGIDAAIDAGLHVKINMVVKKNVNENQVVKLASYCKEKNITLRFIEFMDVGQTNGWDFSQVVTKKELLKLVSTIAPLEEVEREYLGEVASRYRYVGTDSEIGIISSVSDTFCGNCTRARISANGIIYTCLFAEKGFDLRALVRSGATDAEINAAITDIWRSEWINTQRNEQKKR